MKNIKGGYTMVDCKGMNLLAQSTQTISGLFADVDSAFKTGKPIQAYNCVYGTGVALTPINVFAIKEAGNYKLTASILQITVTPDNEVTVLNLVTG